MPKRALPSTRDTVEPHNMSGYSNKTIKAPGCKGDGSTARSAATDSGYERRYAFRRTLDTVKEAVPLSEYAGRLTSLRRSGTVFVGRCPLPDHEDVTPSFTVWPDSNSWWCFGCSRGSDVVDLYFYLHDCARMWEALVGLSLEWGVELPGRSEAWHRATRRKAEYRSAAYRVLGNVLKRRLYKTLILPYIDLIEDPGEHERELKRSWREWAGCWCWPHLAEDLIAGNEDAFRTIAVAKAETDRVVSEAAQERKSGP